MKEPGKDRRKHRTFRFLFIRMGELFRRLRPGGRGAGPAPGPRAADPPSGNGTEPQLPQSNVPRKPPPNEPFFIWIPSHHSIGVARFDQEHKLLAGLINQIHLALIQNHSRADAAELMSGLLRETRLHFEREESALRAAAYPELEAHMNEHLLLLQEANVLFRQFQDGRISGMAFPTYLKKWLLVHIEESDRKYCACLRRNGEP